MITFKRIVPLIFTLILTTSSQAAVVYNEAINGDFSNNYQNPTSITLATGANDIFGTTGKTGTTVDRDIFTFTIAPGTTLNSITVLAGTTVGGNASFIGLAQGLQLPFDPNSATTASGLLGYYLYSTADIGKNILGNISVANNGSSDFSTPLGAGNYTVWIQETRPTSVNYGFRFQVPTPATLWLVIAGGLGMFSIARSKQLSA